MRADAGFERSPPYIEWIFIDGNIDAGLAISLFHPGKIKTR
jgi:hypothetical protein